MSDYTPTTEEVREDFAFPWSTDQIGDKQARLEAYDRWLAEHDAALIEKLADEVRDLQIKDTEGFYDSQTYRWIREKARQRREERA